VLPTPGPAYSVAPNSAWVTVPDANWINSRTTNASTGGTVVSVDTTLPGGDTLAHTVDTGSVGTGTVGTVGAPTGPINVGVGTTTTTFRTQFSLPAEVVARSLEIDYAADNGVTFYLNGTPIGGYDPGVASSNASQVAAFSQLHPLVATVGFQDGLNTLDAVVSDYGVATGLLVRGAVHGCAVRGKTPSTCVDVRRTDGSVVTYSPVPVGIDTGNANAAGVDTRWHTGPLGAGPAYVTAPHPGWWAQSSRASWISVAADDYGPTSPGTYTYSITFNLGSNVSYGGIVLDYAADNAVAFALNGTPIGGYAAGEVASAFNQTHHLALPSAPLHAGSNTLTATVTDYSGVTGLLVEGDVFVCRSQIVLPV
jgi:hypothetical protein